jgi:hypothetical protein
VTTNLAGRAYALTVLTPVMPGHDALLRQCLAKLNRGAASPLASLPATHFARWVVFDRPAHTGAPLQSNAQGSPHLLFDSCLDGDRDEYLEAMRTGMSAAADAIWEHCVGYPGSGDAQAFAAYFRRHQVDARLFLAAYPVASVHDVRSSLALRQRLIDFALATQGFDAPALLAAYRQAFPDARAGGRVKTPGS